MQNHSNRNELGVLMQIKVFSLSILEHQGSLRDQDKQQLGNSLFGSRIQKFSNNFSGVEFLNTLLIRIRVDSRIRKFSNTLT